MLSTPNTSELVLASCALWTSVLSSQVSSAVTSASTAHPPTAIRPVALRQLTMAFPSASNEATAKVAAEAAFARLPSCSGSSCRCQIRSTGSHAGNAWLTSRGASTAPHQNATAPSNSKRPVPRITTADGGCRIPRSKAWLVKEPYGHAHPWPLALRVDCPNRDTESRPTRRPRSPRVAARVRTDRCAARMCRHSLIIHKAAANDIAGYRAPAIIVRRVPAEHPISGFRGETDILGGRALPSRW